jgi:hypothetical protein
MSSAPETTDLTELLTEARRNRAEAHGIPFEDVFRMLTLPRTQTKRGKTA